MKKCMICFMIVIASAAQAARDRNIVTLIQTNNNTEAKKLFEKGADINATEGTETYLSLAAHYGNLDMVMYLAGKGADMKGDRNPLFSLARSSKSSPSVASVVSYLVSKGADVEGRTSLNETPLHLASAKANTALVKALIAVRADVNAADRLGNTPLMKACMTESTNRVEVAKLLVNAGADVNAVTGFNNYQTMFRGASPLLCVTFSADIPSKRCEELAKYLISRGASVNYITGEGKSILRAIRDRNENGDYKGNYTAIIAILEMAGATDEGSGGGISKRKTAFTKSEIDTFFFNAQEGNLEQIKTMVSAGIDLNIQDDEGYTALMTAAFKGHGKIVNFLISKKANLNIKSKDGSTAISVAKARGFAAVAHALRKAGALEE